MSQQPQGKQTKQRKQKGKGNTGRWTKSQHEKFLNAIEKYGRNWVKVGKKIKNRSLAQIRSHAQKFFLNMSETDIKAFIGSQDQFSTNLQDRGSGTNIKKKDDEPEIQKSANLKVSGYKPIKVQEQNENENPIVYITSQLEGEERKGNKQLQQSKVIICQTLKQKNQQKNIVDYKFDSFFIQSFKYYRQFLLAGGNFLNLISYQRI